MSIWGFSKFNSILLLSLLSLMLLSGCKGSKSQQSGAQQAQQGTYSGNAYPGKLELDDGQWLRPAKDYASTRFSSLDQINTQNIGNLKVAFTFDTGTDRGQEAAPLV